jgi:hypothetical protein
MRIVDTTIVGSSVPRRFNSRSTSPGLIGQIDVEKQEIGSR